MQNDDLTRAFLEEIKQSRMDHKEGLEKISDSLKALNETNVLHAERVNDMNTTVQASADALLALSEGWKAQRPMIRFYQIIILLLIFTLIVVAGAEKVFQYTTFIKLP